MPSQPQPQPQRVQEAAARRGGRVRLLLPVFSVFRLSRVSPRDLRPDIYSKVSLSRTGAFEKMKGEGTNVA